MFDRTMITLALLMGLVTMTGCPPKKLGTQGTVMLTAPFITEIDYSALEAKDVKVQSRRWLEETRAMNTSHDEHQVAVAHTPVKVILVPAPPVPAWTQPETKIVPAPLPAVSPGVKYETR